MERTTKRITKKITIGAVWALMLTACFGGGGGAPVVYYPYQTVYGDICSTMTPTPGCTFNRDGSRVTVAQDSSYNNFGGGSNDMYWVQFDYTGTARVYDRYNNLVAIKDVSQFAGYVGGTTIGVGVTGLFWENVAGGQYWLGTNGVLYSANYGSNYGQAINNEDSGEASDTNFAALSSESNKALVKAGADKLVKEYGFKEDKAQVIASALNTWAVSSVENGYTTEQDMDRTFTTIFGVEYSNALAAVKDLQNGGDDKSKDKMRELTNRSAAALGLQPHEAKKFMKGMYSQALASWGYDVNNFDW